MPNSAINPKSNTSAVALVKDISDSVMLRINDMLDHNELVLPANYNAGTALRSAMLLLQDTKDKNGRTAIEVCTKASVVNSMLNMVIQGLQPAQKQCYFIVYGNQLQMFRSYFGTQCALRRAVPEVHKIVTDLVREGDQVETSTNQYGERFISRILTDPLTNYGKPFTFGFCNIYDEHNNILASTLMSWQEIQTAWRQSRNYKAEGGGVHQKFPVEMAKRTLISRACKNLLNSAVERDAIIAGAFNETTDAEYERVDVDAPKEERKAVTVKQRYQIGRRPEAQDPVVPEAVTEEEPENLADEIYSDDGIPWPEADAGKEVG
jgi:recombination protein RecT